MDGMDERFAGSGQAGVRMDIALDKYLQGDRGIYREFVEGRIFSALDFLVRREDCRRLEVFLECGLVGREMRKRILREVPEMPLCVRRLVMGQRLRAGISERLAGRLKEYGVAVGMEFPALRMAVAQFCVVQEGGGSAQTIAENRACVQVEAGWCGCTQGETEVYAHREGKYAGVRGFGTDGACVYCTTADEADGFVDVDEEYRAYQHMLVHCLLGHVNPPEGVQVEVWNMACDMEAEECAKRIFGNRYGRYPGAWKGTCVSDAGIQTNCPERTEIRVGELYHTLLQKQAHDSGDMERLLAEVSVRDDHRFWYRPHGQEDIWSRIAGRMGAGAGEKGSGTGHAGLRPGSRREKLLLREEGRYDFRRYLERFRVTREELQLDEESFAYIPYMFGMLNYGNLPLLEPLEYTEASKVQELVIAIDTSGSCSKDVVSRFLEETKTLLTARENFFRRMKVHIIQCDSMIQQHQVIHSVEEWNQYIADITIEGRGGTDFTPVFRYVNQILQEEGNNQLKGLLYFTDGDGVYPREKPVYETAFVFTSRRFLNYRIPEWIVPLCLNEDGRRM